MRPEIIFALFSLGLLGTSDFLYKWGQRYDLRSGPFMLVRSLRNAFDRRPWWMNGLMVFCAYMAAIYMPFDFLPSAGRVLFIVNDESDAAFYAGEKVVLAKAAHGDISKVRVSSTWLGDIWTYVIRAVVGAEDCL